MSVLASEIEFAKNLLQQLAPLRIVYPDHYVPYEKCFRPKSMLKSLSFAPSSQSVSTVNLRFKCIKPAKEATLQLSSSISIQDLKMELIKTWSLDSTSTSLKLVHKGKALSDDKSLDMYPALLEDSTLLHVMVMSTPPTTTTTTITSSSNSNELTSSQEATNNKGSQDTVSPLEAFGKNAMFWSELRQVVEKHAYATGYSKAEVTKIINAFSHALFQAYK